MYVFSEGQIFIIFLIIGLCIGMFFDFFRALRKNLKTPDFITLIQDILFMAIVGIFTINAIIIVNNGQIRFFILIAILFGISFYFLTISKICFIIFTIFIRFCKKILYFPIFCKKIFKKRRI